MALDLALCDKTCIECIHSYKKKHSLQPGQKFRIKCSGIPDFEQLELFSAQNGNDTALSLLDPVKWAADTLDWHCLDPDGEIWKRKDPEEYGEWVKNNPNTDIKGKSRYHRPYQALLMQCSSRRKVFRMGRQCIARDQYIYTPNGPIQVADLRESQETLGGVSSFIDEHEDTIYLVKFANGSSLKVNGEHPFFTRSGWKNAINLSISDEVQFQSVDMFEVNTSTIIDKDLAKLVGYLLSDGYFAPEQSVKFTNNNLSLIEDVEQLTAKFFPTLVPKRRIKSNGFDVHLTHQHGTHSHNPIDLYLKDLGVYNKITLGSILTTTDEAIKQFIAGYFNGDGYLWHYKRPTRNGYRAEVGFAIGLSQRKAYEFQYLLWRLGIHSVIKSEWMKKSTAPFYRVLVSRHSDQLKLLEFLDTVKYPEKFQEHKRILDTYKEKKYDTFSQIKSIKTISTDKVRGWETTTGEIIGLLGMRTHNCGKTEALVVSILYNMFVKPGKGPDQGFEVVVVAPYQAQIDLLFRRLEQLINSSASTSNAIRRNVKAPVYTLELNNGSIIKGFTAGTKSAGDAASVRGQHADLLCFDEADFLAPGDMDAALNIITNYPNASVWMSSTPSGKREKFYQTCYSTLWKEFYYPSSVNPMWNLEMEQMYQEQLTELAYLHECFLGNTEVLTSSGKKNISDITTEDILLDSNLQQIRVLCQGFITGEKEVYEYQTVAGVLQCTPSHHFPDRQFDKKPINSLQEVPVYLVPRYLSHNRDVIYARLVGYNLGDGSSCSTRYQSSFYSSRKRDMEHLCQDIMTLYPKYRGQVIQDITYGHPNGLVKVDSDRFSVNVSKTITLDLLKLGIIRGKKTECEFDVPDWIKNGTQDIQANFLAALFGAEGSTPRESNGYTPSTITLTMYKKVGSSGQVFFDSLVTILLSLGIRATTKLYIREDGYQAYCLYIYNDMNNMLTFFEKVGYLYAQEKELLGFYWLQYLRSFKYAILQKQQIFQQVRILKEQGKTYDEILRLTNLTKSQIDKAINLNRNPIRLYQSSFLRFEKWVENHVSQDVLFIEILTQRFIGIYPVYNITVDSVDHSYLLANGIRTFNCRAEFGEQEQGVFQNAYIQNAKLSYKYGDIPRVNSWQYTIGVDWNDTKIGTSIVVLGFDPARNVFQIVDKKTVSKIGWTQTSSCQKIAELNRLWRPIAIYIDSGYGSSQWEILRKFGFDSTADPTKGPNHPDSKLREIVKKYEFGGTVEIRDLFTKMPIKKPAKAWLVESTVRRFESGDIKFSDQDEKLEKQLASYIIERKSVAGVPVYGTTDDNIGDHDLDALMLSIIAFVMEVTPFGKPKYTSDIAFSGQFGSKVLPLPGEGGLVISGNESKKYNSKPVMQRTENVEKTTLLGITNGLPGAHLQRETKIGIWNWPGFMRDEPRPESRSLAQAEKEAQIRLGLRPRKNNRPSRKNI